MASLRKIRVKDGQTQSKFDIELGTFAGKQEHMDLSQIKMVVSDMDGTLLNSQHQVSERFFSLYEGLRERGIIFVAASGRQHHSIVDKLGPITQDIVIIAENGGLATYKEENLVWTPLAPAAKQKTLQLLEAGQDIHPVLCGHDKAYILGDSKDFEKKLQEYYTEYAILDDLKTFDGEILKIAIYHYESSEKYVYPLVQSLEDELKVKVSGSNWVDVSDPLAHKGHALEVVQQKFGISPAETLVFGDYNNDLEMMALSDFSYAMANAHPNVKKAARYQTLSNDEFGVETVLQEVLESQIR